MDRAHAVHRDGRLRGAESPGRDDPLAAFREAAAGRQTAFGRPGTLEEIYTAPFGTVPHVSYEEKGTWVYLVTSAGAYAVYLAIILGQVLSGPVARVPYVPVLLWTTGASIVASITGRILVETASPSDSRRTDVRDREITRFGEYASRWFLVAGAAAALVMAMAKWDYF